MSESFKGWSVDRNYRRARVWHFKSSGGEYTGIITIRIDSGKIRRERYDMLAENMKTVCDITIPEYIPSKKESKDP